MTTNAGICRAACLCALLGMAPAHGGRLRAWGANEKGQLAVPPGTNYVAVAAGGGHGVAVRADGSLAGWGYNAYGQATVPTGACFVAVAAGGTHSMALRRDGSLAGWGDNSYGQVMVPPGTCFVAIAAGGKHCLALRRNGTVAAWGATDCGQATVPAATDIVAIAAGGLHSLALRRNGALLAWGDNYLGQTRVPDATGFVAVAAGYEHGCALRVDGMVVKWGVYDRVPPANAGFAALVAGGDHSIAIRADGSWLNWGYPIPGQESIPHDQLFAAMAAGEDFIVVISAAARMAPAVPYHMAPLDGECVGRSALLQSSPVDADEPGAHVASQWQISRDRAFRSVLWDSGSITTRLTSMALPDVLRGKADRYYWRVRYGNGDGQWSSYSTPGFFELDPDVAMVESAPGAAARNGALGVPVTPALMDALFPTNAAVEMQ